MAASISFYDCSVKPLKASVASTLSILAKSKAWAEKTSTSEAELFSEARLAPDMYPLSFQFMMIIDIINGLVCHIRGTENPPLSFDKLVSFAIIEEAVRAASAQLDSLTVDEVNAAATKEVTLKLGPVVRQQVFIDGMVTGYSLPNIFFHITTAYAILRSKGADLGKAEFISPFLGPSIAACASKK
ncbi:hypothetical protein CFIMG_005180RAa [Ceratocystis fimbriata CBS 114723]|uniref:DUF1993 domain-containing protein n=1 Tax=Ceratocystis fimbriata CBS 114723 TaxID=1035309 RepID=A0A2C5WXG7_9PEZI|nr:hypothetical protein CFIMG_005180RAa [Ceratocystis fimbriata CBS 114723]